MLKSIYLWIKRIIYMNVHKGEKIVLRANSQILKGTTLEGKNLIGSNSKMGGFLGRGSYLGENCFIRGYVGRYCSISNNVRVVIGNHPIHKNVSTHPCFYSERKQAGFTYTESTSFEEIKYAKEKYHVFVGNDVWIGESVLIYGGITIGDGAVIAAGSIVNKDVPPYTIVGGVPAKELSKRFSDEEINNLLDIKWWNFSESEIMSNYVIYNDINCFMSKYKGAD